MFFILVFTTIAAVAFRRVAREKGYHSPRFWLFPLAVGGTVTVASLVLGVLARVVTRDGDSLLAIVYPFFVDALCLLILCCVIIKAWRQIKALPPRR